jgi:hypothetical protein
MLPPRYDDHKAINRAETRHQERHFSHVRELRGRERMDGLVSMISGRLWALRSVLPKRAAIAFDEHELTDYVCRLADGSMGRVAIREADGDWIGVCVKAP